MSDHRYSAHRNGIYVEVPPMDELCTVLKEKFLRQEERIEHLENQVKQLNDEAYKDEEMAKMKAKVKEMQADYWRGFPISEEEDKAIKNWMKNHEKDHPGGHGCSGGKYTYCFIPTAIGTIGTIKCGCGAEFDFQDI